MIGKLKLCNELKYEFNVDPLLTKSRLYHTYVYVYGSIPCLLGNSSVISCFIPKPRRQHINSLQLMMSAIIDGSRIVSADRLSNKLLMSMQGFI